MEEKDIVLTLDDPIPFTYPEGMKQVAAMLTFLPEEAREPVLMGFANIMTSILA